MRARGSIVSAALVVASFVLAPGARAQESAWPESVTLGQLLDMVGQSPRLAAEAAGAEALRGDVRSAAQHPNPILSYDFSGFLGGGATNGGSQSTFLLSQPLLWPGQLDRRVEAARAALDAARARVAVFRAFLEIELRRAFVELLAAQQRTAVLGEIEAAMERIVQIVRGRAEAGAGRRWDVVRVEGELASVRAARDAGAADVHRASGRIGELIGIPSWFPRAEGTLAEIALGEMPDAVREGHPVLEAARRAVAAARARVEAERAFAVPPIELGIGGIATTWPEGGYLIGRVAMPLPVFDANQGPIERAEREADAAELVEAATRNELEAALLRARRVVDQRREALESFERGVVERMPLLLEMAEAAYRAGEVGAFELLDAVRASRDIRIEQIEREKDLRLAEVDLLEAALGAAVDAGRPAH
jgi:cobalt-zinc-cadmium efflux system outer membrane protein